MVKQIYNILDSPLIQYTFYDESGVMCYEYGNMREVTKEYL